MMLPRLLPFALGALAVGSGTAIMVLDILFAISLFLSTSLTRAKIFTCIASGLGLITVLLLLVLLGRQIRYRSGAHIQDFGHGKRYSYLLAGFAAMAGILEAMASAVTLCTMESQISQIPRRIIGSPTRSLVIGAFVTWAIALLSQALFLVTVVVVQRRDFQQQIQTYTTESLPQIQAQMQQPTRPRSESAPESSQEKNSCEVSTPTSSDRSRAESARSSISQVVRPITSKTRLIPGNQKALTIRPPSIDSAHQDSGVSIEDTFDSWDTSAVDPQSRQVMESASSPTPQRFLETIPASPTGSRSPSPGFPLDLEPPKSRKRSRSYSPATVKEMPKTPRTISPAGSVTELHIHPLFRTDSPTPPPAATPGTIVTAAPNAGQVITDRKSVHRMRSGSLPSSPLVHSGSLDSMRHTIDDEQRSREESPLEDTSTERTLTPPIPEWILGAASRNSMSGYTSRKKPQAGLGKLGEAAEVLN